MVVVVARALLSSWTETMTYAMRTRFAANTAVNADAVASPEKVESLRMRVEFQRTTMHTTPHVFLRQEVRGYWNNGKRDAKGK